MKIIFPNTYYNYIDFKIYENLGDGPVFYLAGPIPGGELWQIKACEILKGLMPTNRFVIVSPCRFPQSETFHYYGVSNNEQRFADQLEWEQYYLNLAATKGCVIFWLPRESDKHPRNDGRPYAMMTRDELGVWREKLRQNPRLHVVMGGEEGFPGLPELERYNELFLSPYTVQMCRTLEETIREAMMSFHRT